MEPKAVVERLKEYGQTRADSDWNDLDVETRRLIRKSPFAFLIAVAFDRGMPWQKAWRIPTEIDRQGGARQICETALRRRLRHVAPRNPRSGR